MSSSTRSEPEQTRAGETAASPALGRLRSFLFHGTEIVVAMIMVFFFFLTFLGIISFGFPQGTNLRDLVVQQRWVEQPRPTSDPPNDVIKGHDTGSIRARLASMRRVVKSKDSHAIAWSSARSGMALDNRDSIQTFARSGARISLGRKNEVDLGENSLIVIRRPVRRQASTPTQTRIVFDGALEPLSQTGDDDAGAPVEIATASGASAILTDGASSSRLVIATNPDNTSTFSLHSGSAEIISGGRSVMLSANQALTVDGVTPPEAPVALPGRPRLTQPVHDFSLTYRMAPPSVQLDWKDEPDCDGYRVMISRDRQFNDVVYDGRVAETALTHGNLASGRYYWRVSGLKGRYEGAPSAARRLALHQDDVPPPLSVDLPSQVRNAQLFLTGATEPGAEVFIGDRAVPASRSGTFEYALNLQRGVNVVVVEAVDSAGNVSYRSELISAKY